MAQLLADPRVRAGLLVALAAASLAPPPMAIPALVVCAGLWLVGGGSRSGRLVVAAGTLAAVALLAAAWRADPGPALAGERLRRHAARAYAANWGELDRVAEAARRALVSPPGEGEERLRAFETLARAARSAGDVTLLLYDANGSAVAWAGPGLLHEPRAEQLGAERFYVAGFSAVTLLRAVQLEADEEPWRLVAGRSLSCDRLIAVPGRPAGPPVRWTLVEAGAEVRPGLLEVRLAGAPTLLVEPRLEGAPAARGRAPLARLAMLVIAALVLILAARAPRELPLARWLRPEVGMSLAVVALALGVTPARTAGLLAALAWAASGVRAAAGRRPGPGAGALRGWIWGLAAAATALAAALARQLRVAPLDLGPAIFAGADSLALRISLAALTLGFLARALGPPAPAPAPRAVLLGGLAVLALLLGAALHDLPLAGAPMLLLGSGAAGAWAASAGGPIRTRATILMLCAALVAAAGWELGYRVGLRAHLEQRVLPRLSLPTTAELAELAREVREYVAAVDLESLALQPPERLDRQDLAYELWHHSPLASRGVLSALAVVPEQGPISTFAFGLPLTEAGRPDDSPLRRPEPVLPVWDDTREAGSVELTLGGRRWGIVRYWLRPRPGFRLEALPATDLAADLLRDGPFLRPPAEEIAAPASFALFTAEGLPAYSAWGEGPRLAGELLGGGRGLLATPAGATTVYTQPGPEGVRALMLPRLAPGPALERVGVFALSAVAVASLALLLAALAGGRAELEPLVRGALRSYSRRLLAVYGLLLLLPVLLLGTLFVRFTAERLQRDQRAGGEAALESAQRVLGEYVLSLETGFVIDTQLDNKLLVWLASVIRHDVNLYWGSTVYVSSKPELFTAGFLPKRIPGEIYSRLLLRSRERGSRVNRVGGADYLELYAPLKVPGVALDRARLFVSVPLLAQEEEVAVEIAALRRRAALVTSGLLLVMALVGARLGRGFTRPLEEIAEGTRRIAEGASSLALEPADEELATLTRAIDRMAARIAEGRRRLTREKKVVELMVENINAAVVSLDAKRRVVLHNRVAGQLLGARVGEPLPAGERPGLAELSAFVAESGGQPRQRTIRLGEDPDAPQEWSLVWAPLPGHGDPAALLVVEDVTEVLRVERLEAWAEMARVIAHEIKNPLTPIRLSAEHMRQVWRDHPEEFAETFERCTANILHQVEELRVIALEFSTYSRIPKIERRAGDLVAAIDEVAAAYGAAAGDDGARVRWRRPLEALPLELDSRLIGRAVRNLIENALRVSGDGARVELTVERQQGEAVIRVGDRGPGVPNELLGRIFDPYFSTHDTGTGLGLPIARRIAEAHGGSMRARNREGGGLEVEIRLPLSDRAVPARTAGS